MTQALFMRDSLMQWSPLVKPLANIVVSYAVSPQLLVVQGLSSIWHAELDRSTRVADFPTNHAYCAVCLTNNLVAVSYRGGCGMENAQSVIRIFDISQNARLVRKIYSPADYVHSMTLLPGNVLVACARFMRIYQWQLDSSDPSAAPFCIMNAHDDFIADIITLPNNRFASVADDPMLKIWAPATDVPLCKISLPRDPLVTCLLSDTHVAVGLEEGFDTFGYIAIVDTEVGTCETFPKTGDRTVFKSVRSLVCTPVSAPESGTRSVVREVKLFSGGSDAKVRVWRVSLGGKNTECVCENIQYVGLSISCLSLMPNGLVACCHDTTGR